MDLPDTSTWQPFDGRFSDGSTGKSKPVLIHKLPYNPTPVVPITASEDDPCGGCISTEETHINCTHLPKCSGVVWKKLTHDTWAEYVAARLAK